MRRSRGLESRTLFSFASTIVSVLFWSTCNYMADTATVEAAALLWTRLAFVAALMMGYSIFYFSLIFPVEQSRKFVWSVLYGSLFLLFSFFSVTEKIITGVEIKNGIGVSGVTFGSMYIGIIIFYLFCIFHPSFIFIKNYVHLTGNKRQQVKYVLIGWFAFLGIAIITNAILPFLTGNANWSKFGPLGSIIMVIATGYAIIRYEFLNIKIIIQRGIVYTALLSIITSTYVGLVFLGELLLRSSSGLNITISALITTIVGIFGVPPLKQYFTTLTDPIFFKDKYSYGAVIASLTDALNKTIVLDSIIEKTSAIITQNLKVSSIEFQLGNGEGPKAHETALVLPINSNKKRIGYLIVGEKRSQDPFTQEDRHLLETFTKQAGIALEKASLYKQVKEYANTLEQKVAERTQEIKNIQRDQESLMLEISHGLQTPLTVMKGELFFLRKQGADQEKIEVLDTSIDRISAFIYRLLNISQLESSLGKEQRELSLSSTLTSLLGFFQEEALRKNIILSGKIDNNITILGNEDEITELFSNLISNSIKYIGQKSEKTIAVEATIHDTVTVVTIKDSGIGMEALEVKKLFQKFSRIKNEYTKNIPGTGLGLAICKKIVEIHKGTIAVTSNLGEGTSIAISLPLYKK